MKACPKSDVLIKKKKVYSGSVFLNASFGRNVVFCAFNYEKVLNSKEVTHCVAVKKESSKPSMVVFSRKFVYYILFSISFSFRQIFSFSFGLSFFLILSQLSSLCELPQNHLQLIIRQLQTKLSFLKSKLEAKSFGAFII